MAGWVLWAILACACGVGEMLSGGFYLAPFAVGAALAAVGAAVAGSTLAVIVFVGVSLLSLALVRPVVRARTRMPPGIRAGAAALVGRDALVLERIANRDGIGLVRIDGEVWTARCLYEDEEIEAGARVEVVDIKGATALVI